MWLEIIEHSGHLTYILTKDRILLKFVLNYLNLVKSISSNSAYDERK